VLRSLQPAVKMVLRFLAGKPANVSEEMLYALLRDFASRLMEFLNPSPPRHV
jgi:hypothetical protein